MIREYLQDNLGRSFLTSPFRAPPKSWVLVPLFVVISVLVGFGAELLEYKPVSSDITPILPFLLFVFPSLLEESFFRGVLIRREIMKYGRKRATQTISVSTLAFVAWHPINALAFNHTAIPLFLNPSFLIIVGALGVTCGYSYIVSKSIWVPVIIHWATVTVWVLFLGGRNLVLEL